MAGRINTAVSVTPIVTATTGSNSDPAVSVASLHSTVGKTLSGGGVRTVTDYGAVAYQGPDASTTIGPSSDQSVGSAGGASGALFVRNVGLDDNGDVSAATLTVKSASAGAVIAVLKPGEAIVLPGCALTLHLVSSSGQLQYEFANLLVTS